MGIEIELYRARIGGFNCRYAKMCGINFSDFVLKVVLCYDLTNVWFFILSILAGDIETNPGPKTQKSINGLLLNVHSLKSVNVNRNKLVDFRSLVEVNKVSVAALCETWLNPSINNSEILPPGDFKIYRKDRKDGYGGVLLAVKNCIPSTRKLSLEVKSDNHNECVVVELRPYRQPKIAMVVFYRVPNDNSPECVENLKKTLMNVQQHGYQNVCVLGDFNLPNFDWDTGIPTDNRNKAESYYDIFQEHSLTQLVHGPTHNNGNTLDLILSNFPNRFRSIYTEEDMFHSDHLEINFTLDINV